MSVEYGDGPTLRGTERWIRWKALLFLVALIGKAALGQIETSNLKGKRICMPEFPLSVAGPAGFIGLRDWLASRAEVYGYAFESPRVPNSLASMDSLYGQLYTGAARAGRIDILILSHGEGDGNVAGSPALPGAAERMARVNAHVRSGGGLVLVNYAGGRRISSEGWIFGAMLMTDWFTDAYEIQSPTGKTYWGWMIVPVPLPRGNAVRGRHRRGRGQ